jgi:hypothetical protein
MLVFYVNYDISDGITTQIYGWQLHAVFVLLAHDFIIFGEQQNRDSPFMRVSFVVKHCERDGSYDVPSATVFPSDKDGRGRGEV